ncbi:MAG: succinate dehydrogenase, cytochrome b556 subunit [Gammaproteobacteria bacterium]|nr:succinate dehydrogenase, cytochrome b556 subunit [Gammaproteobacteria bacterium]
MPNTVSRPRFLNLLLIRMPVGAITSFAHRVSGVLLFLCIPLAAFLLDMSLQGPDGFTQAADLLVQPLSRAVQLVIAWSLAHHLLAGIRFLLIDLEIGLNKSQARASALAVNVAAPLLAGLLLWRLW